MTIPFRPVPPRRRHTSHTGRRTVRLAGLALEVRCTPATFTVTTTGDGGPGSLRSAILRANAAPGADRIAFAVPTADAGFVDADGDGRFDSGDYWSIAPSSA